MFLSLGGNDALMNADLLDTPIRSTGQALDLFRERIDAFHTSYGYALEALLALGRPATVCTVYHGNLAPGEASRAPTALALFNDAILRSALRLGASVIDLREICNQPSHFANPIEPSGAGGLEIARALLRSLEPDLVGPRRITLSAG